MKKVLFAEAKYSVLNIQFLCGSVFMLAVFFIAGTPYVSQIISNGYSVEGIGWISAYVYSVTAESSLLFIPIAASFAAGSGIEDEMKSRYVLFSCIRVKKRNYLIGKIISAALTGGLVVLCAAIVLSAVLFLQLRNIPTIEGSNFSMGIWETIFLSFFRIFLNGSLWALVGNLISLAARNRYLTYAAPFILYYVLTVFQERYYPKYSFLSPRQWAAPVAYHNWICIGILFGLSLFVSSCLMIEMRRRLNHA